MTQLDRIGDRRRLRAGSRPSPMVPGDLLAHLLGEALGADGTTRPVSS
ncbi:MAG TPA: hypothetical protein VGB74_06360 [Actinoplanes sp.]